jgi:tripartite-type tricarboxylate transporter receptor subunit TctC
MNRVLVAVAAVAAALGSVAAAQAQSYPSRPITIIVGFPPGGPTDIVARVVGEKMRESLGQPIIIENVSGAAGTVGGARVASAAPDGYTLNVGQWTTQVGAGAIYPIKYHVKDSFEPISLLTASYLWIIGKKDLPANNMKELVALAKASPGKLTSASVGAGSAGHMCLVDFQNKSGTQFQHIPYRGGAPATQALLGGQVDTACLEASQTLPQYRAGNLKIYGVVAKKRWFGAPEVPTVAEAGVPDVELTFWHGLWGPKGLPKAVVAKLNDAVKKAFADPAVKQRFASLGHVIPPVEEQNPEALAKHHQTELDKWWPIIKAAGIKTQQ